MGEREDHVRWDGPGVEAWDAWAPADLARRLEGVDVPWCVVGGWSIDLFLGEATRPHLDLEIATQRQHLAAIRSRLDGFVFHAVGDGSVRRLAADEDSPPDCHQHWVLDESAQRWRADVMLEPGDRDWWVYRRDERIRAPRAQMVAETGDGVPYLLPPGSLLFKAKTMSAKDRADFEAVLPRLTAEAKAWLADALALAHPGHEWIERLGGRSSQRA